MFWVAAARWLYHAMAAKENLLNNGFGDDQVKVVYKRPTDLAMLRDVPVSCNVCVNDVLEDGLLAAGLVPSFRHAHDRLLMPDAIVVPSSAQVMVMPVEMRTRTCRGLDVSAMNAYRWTPTHTSGGVPIADDAWTALARPAAAFRFDFQTPPEEGETREADLRFERDGRFNAVLFWYDLNLIEGVELSTAPRGYGPGEDPDDPESAFEDSAISSSSTKAARPTSLRVAMQYLPGEIEVKAGDALPLVCAHNTVQMQFSVPEAEYLHLRKLDASFPQYHFAMLADKRRARAYDEAIQRRVGEVTKRDGEARVLDVGAGSGLLSMMAARAGARSALACEWHGSLAACARSGKRGSGDPADASRRRRHDPRDDRAVRRGARRLLHLFVGDAKRLLGPLGSRLRRRQPPGFLLRGGVGLGGARLELAQTLRSLGHDVEPA